MTKEQAAARREVRAALQHRRTCRLARYEDLAGRKHDVLALGAKANLVICDRTLRATAEPIGCVAVLDHSEADAVGALIAEYLRWAPLGERAGIREVTPTDVAGDSDEGARFQGEPPPWEELCGEMTHSCREALDERPRRGQELAA